MALCVANAMGGLPQGQMVARWALGGAGGKWHALRLQAPWPMSPKWWVLGGSSGTQRMFLGDYPCPHPHVGTTMGSQGAWPGAPQVAKAKRPCHWPMPHTTPTGWWQSHPSCGKDGACKVENPYLEHNG